MARSRTRLTNTFVSNLDKYLIRQHKRLDKPQSVSDATVIGLLVRRQPNGRALWYFAFSVPGGRRSRVALGSYPAVSVDQAREAAKVIAGDVARKVDPVAEKRAAALKLKSDKALVLGSFVEGRYSEWAQQHLKSHAETLAALAHDFADMWDWSMARIGSLDIERWQRKKTKEGLKPATINRSMDRLRAVLRRANEWGVLPGALPRFKKLKTGDLRVRYLSDDERKRLFAALDAREIERREQRQRMNEWLAARNRPPMPQIAGRYADHLQPLVRLILGTGLRRGEALQLTWLDVNFDRKQIGVRGETAKDSEFRSVPMTDDVFNVMSAWRDQTTDTAPGKFVFARRNGKRIHAVSKSWTALILKAKIENFRLHDLRHDFASCLVSLGTPLYTVSRLLGHSTTEMSERYAHLSPDHLQAAVAKLNELARSAA